VLKKTEYIKLDLLAYAGLFNVF